MNHRIQNNRQYRILAVVVVLALRLVYAYLVRDFRTSDYNKHLSTWYDQIQSMGGFPALHEQIGNYGILYQFLICLMTYLPVSSLAAYKLLSLLFDIILSFVSGRFVLALTEGMEETRRDLLATIACVVTLLLPTACLNSSLWAQCDSIYSTCAVLAVLCLCMEMDAAAFLLFGVAFSFKLQAIFVLPVLLLVAFMRRRLHYVVLSVVSWYATCIPGILAGRSLLSPLEIYQNQATQYPYMSANFPSFWLLSSGDYSKWGHVAIFGTAALLALYMLVILYLHHRHYVELTPTFILEIACLFAWTCVAFLPCMHERYSYCLEILLLILAMVDRRYLACLVLEESQVLVGYVAYLRREGSVTAVNGVIYVAAYAIFAILVLLRIIRTRRNQ